jgi:hypothetical protein
MEEAFAFCRRLDKPVQITVTDKPNILKVFPSGRCEDTGKAKS